jgi:hypothetical protein
LNTPVWEIWSIALKRIRYPGASDKLTVRTCLLLGWTLALPLAAVAASATTVEARLLTPVSSYSSKSGSAVSALVATSVCFADGATLPQGVTLRGTLEHVHKVGLGFIHESAGMSFAFTEMRMPDGRVFPVEPRLRSIDNARERVDSHGNVHGIRATATLSNRAGQHLAFLAMGHPVLMLPLFAVETSLFRFPDPEIEYGAGTELHLDLTFPAELGVVRRCADAVPPATERAALNDIISGIPAWSYSKRQRQPMDMVNLIFVGSQEELATAFRFAGWKGARPNSVGSGFGAIRAIAERKSDADAPMRTLLLDGAVPDLSLQKSLNTFEMRHHLRIWKRPPEFQGRPVWASAATHDTGATFSVRPFGFTHQIQDVVDLERDKVVSDLRFTGCVDEVYYVPRPNLAEAFEGPYRRSVRTDGRVAVVLLNACQSPRLDLASTPLPQEPLMVRTIRRVTLTARNHFLRDNWWWRGAEAARLTFLTLRGWSREWKDDRLARQQRDRILAQAAAEHLPVEPPAGTLPPLVPLPPSDFPLPAALPPSVALVDLAGPEQAGGMPSPTGSLSPLALPPSVVLVDLAGEMVSPPGSLSLAVLPLSPASAPATVAAASPARPEESAAAPLAPALARWVDAWLPRALAPAAEFWAPAAIPVSLALAGLACPEEPREVSPPPTLAPFVDAVYFPDLAPPVPGDAAEGAAASTESAPDGGR